MKVFSVALARGVSMETVRRSYEKTGWRSRLLSFSLVTLELMVCRCYPSAGRALLQREDHEGSRWNHRGFPLRPLGAHDRGSPDQTHIGKPRHDRTKHARCEP